MPTDNSIPVKEYKKISECKHLEIDVKKCPPLKLPPCQ